MKEQLFSWGTARRFNAWSSWCQRVYGTRLQKVSINAGFTCPNRDGSIGTGGCTFCNNRGFSPSYCHDGDTVPNQIDKGVRFLKSRYKKATRFIAYFQAYSNTYAELEHLKELYGQALSHPEISGISIGTRPDCVDEQKLDYLAELASEYFVSVEYGVESCFDDTLIRINRGHDFESSKNAIISSHKRGLHTGAHIIIGLPGESPEMMLQQSEILSALPINSLKFHQLQIVKDTVMADEYLADPERFTFFEPLEYADFMVDFLERLRPDIAIERIAGEVPPEFNLRKTWGGLRSDQVSIMVEKRLADRDTWQGKFYK